MSRVERLKESLLQIEPKLSCERLHYLREAYKETEGQPTPIRRAKVLDKLLGGMTIFIDENPIVGTLTEHRVGFQLYPEYSCGDCRNSQGDLGTDKLFTGQRLDDTGLYYYGARYYDPTIGRFISPDTVVPDFTNPQAYNRYSYVLNKSSEVY